MTIIERMDAALAKLKAKWGGRRRPKAFYLVEQDWNDFMATDPPTDRFPWGNNPVTWNEEPTFEGVPVRTTKAAVSRLYNMTAQGQSI